MYLCVYQVLIKMYYVIFFGNPGCAARRGRRGGREKEWTDRVQSDVPAFDIAGGCKATALEADEV